MYLGFTLKKKKICYAFDVCYRHLCIGEKYCNACAEPEMEGGRVSTPPLPGKSLSYEFLRNTGLGCLSNHKATKCTSVPSQHWILGYRVDQPAKRHQIAFHWRSDDGPLDLGPSCLLLYLNSSVMLGNYLMQTVVIFRCNFSWRVKV